MNPVMSMADIQLQAAEFLVDMQADGLTPEEAESLQSRLARWRAAHAEHERAWQRILAMESRLVPLASRHVALAPSAILDRAAGLAGRRRAIKRLAVLLAGSAGGLALWRQSEVAPVWLAALGTDVRTGTGERQRVTLPDGSRLQVNAASAVALDFSAAARTVRLIAGELYLQVVRQAQGASALTVQTRHGRILTSDARFGVRQRGEAPTLLSVDDGVTQAAWGSMAGQSVTVTAGHALSFDQSGNRGITRSDASATAWTRGMLIAQAMPLADLLTELGRFRPGHLSCDPAIAALPVSGTFPLNAVEDTDRALGMLLAEHRLLARYFTRYWVNLSAAA